MIKKFHVEAISVPRHRLEHLNVDPSIIQLYRQVAKSTRSSSSVGEPQVITTTGTVLVGTKKVYVGEEPVLDVYPEGKLEYNMESNQTFIRYYNPTDDILYAFGNKSVMRTYYDEDGGKLFLVKNGNWVQLGPGITEVTVAGHKDTELYFGSFVLFANNGATAIFKLIIPGTTAFDTGKTQSIYKEVPVYEETKNITKGLITYIRRK